MSESVARETTALPVGAIKESKWNPRKHYDKDGLKELVESVKLHGVITPLLVRKTPDNGYWEIAAGHRRLRAAIVAGLKEVPVIVRPMSDEEFREILTIENLQREDVSAIEEAAAYKAMMKDGKSVAQVAQRVSRSEAYVYDRLGLLSLIPDAQKLVAEGKIPVGHAVLLSRLKPKDQKRAIGTADKDGRRISGLFTVEGARQSAFPGEKQASFKPVSVKEFQGWIDERVRFDRASVDTFLFAETAEDLAAAKEKALKVIPITFDYQVPPEAKDEKGERTYTNVSWEQADGEKWLDGGTGKSKVCKNAVLGVFVVGPHRGETLQVCVARPCDVHRPPQKKKASDSKLAKQKAEMEAAEKKYREEQEEQRRKERTWRGAQKEIVKAVLEKVEKAATTVQGPLGQVIQRSLNVKSKLKGNADELVRMAAGQILARWATEWGAWRDFPKVAKGFGVDVGPILKAVKLAPPKEKEAAPDAHLEEAYEGDGDDEQG